MRRYSFGLAFLLLAAAAPADEVVDRPYLVLQSNGHTAPITKVLFTPDGKRILSVSEDKTVRLWDASSGERLGVFRPPVGQGVDGELKAGALYSSPDEKVVILAVGGVGYSLNGKRVAPIYLIDLEAGRITASLRDERMESIISLAFSPDGKWLAAGGRGIIYLWDMAAGQCLYTLEEPHDATAPADEKYPPDIREIAFSPSGKLLAAACRDKTAWIWSVSAKMGRKVAGPLQHDDSVYSVAWKDNDTLATGAGGKGGIHLWDRTGKELQHFDKLRADPVGIESLAFVPGTHNAELFYAWTRHLDQKDDMCESGGSFLDLDSPAKSRDGFHWNHHTTEVRGAVSPDGKLAVTSGGGENHIHIWNVNFKEGNHALTLHGKGMTPFYAYWGEQEGMVAWARPKKAGLDVATPAAPKLFDLRDLTFPSAQGLKMLGANHKGDGFRLEGVDAHTLEVFKNKKGSLKIETGYILQSYTLLPGGRAAVAAGNHLTLYDIETGQKLHPFLGHVGKVWDVAPSPDGRYLLAAFSDQILRIYDPEKEKPLLSLFVAGGDWIAWTVEGFYAASPGGEKMMGWQVNNGPNAFGTFYPAEQFHNAFYRPDIIQRVLAAGSVAKAREAADKEAGRASAEVDVARALPPEVAILSPTESKIDKDVEVDAEAASKDQPIVSLRLLLDGRPFPAAEVKTFPGAKADEKHRATWKVAMPEGEHVLSVRAEGNLSAATSAPFAVTYQPTAQQKPPTLYVLAVGVNAYPGSLKLSWAVKDAESIEAVFKAVAAPTPYAKVETKLLLDKDASKEGILAGLDWLKKNMTSDDTAVVFYAGHGHRDKKTSQFYMLPQDVDVADLEKTAVTGTQIKDKLKAASGRVLVLLDACHSGAIGQSPADPSCLTDDVQRQLAAPDCGVVVMCAAMAQEEAGESAEVKDGFFTKALLLGLGGAAPPDRKDGLIHLTGLNYYVEQAVAELSHDEQHVVVDRPSTVTSFPLVKPPAKSDEK